MTGNLRSLWTAIGIICMIAGSLLLGFSVGYREGVSERESLGQQVECLLADKPPITDTQTAMELQAAGIFYLSFDWMTGGETLELCVTLPLMINYDEKFDKLRDSFMKRGWLVRYVVE